MLALAGTAGLIAAAALAAGCASSSSSSSPASSASSASSPTLAPSASVASSPSAAAPASSPSTEANPASSSPGNPGAAGTGCATRSLKATVGLAQGAAGSVYQIIDFTNISGAACTLFGYPGVALAGGTPVTQIGAAAARSTASSPRLVTLAPGKTANALLRITQAENYPASRCAPKASTYLQIYPPNQTTPIYLAYKSTGCSSSAVNLLTIGVVQPGNGG
jgi:hypothetical protein